MGCLRSTAPTRSCLVSLAPDGRLVRMLLLVLFALGCGAHAREMQHPTTDAQRSGMAMAERSAAHALDCPRVEVEPVLNCRRADGTECPRLSGEQLIARGCGRELRLYCGLCGGDLSTCVSELEIGQVCCETDYSAEAGGQR